MKNLLLVGVLSASLFSCSLLQRHGEAPERDGDAAAPATEAAAEGDGPLFTPGGQEVPPAAANGAESEVSRLNTKVAALETKVDVLSANLERIQAERSQPVIQAEPQANLAAPVGDRETGAAEIQDQTRAAEVSAAPARPARHLPAIPKESVTAEASEAPAKSATGAEREFRAGMELFQNGQNLEAASRFALMAKKFPHHMLAAHALYWAGESAARAQQWAIATENWAELEKKYPHSAYLPEALAGLAKAYDSQGDATKAKLYRSILQRAFPNSPVAQSSGGAASGLVNAAPAAPAARRISRNLEGATEAPTTTGEDPAPVFEEDNGGTPGQQPTSARPEQGAESQ